MEEFRYYGTFTGLPAFDAIVSLYFLTLGDFADTEGYGEAPESLDKNIAWTVFIIGSAVIGVVLMNMLVGILALPFEEIQEN